MSDSTELRIDDADQQAAASEPLSEIDPQSSARLSIAEKYEQRRLAEIEAGREQLGLPPSEPEPEPEPESAPQGAGAADVPEPTPAPALQQPVAQPVGPQAPATVPLLPVPLPNGSVTYVTLEQASQLAGLGAAAIARPSIRPPTEPVPHPTHSPSFDSERAKAIGQRLTFGTPDEQAQALQDFAEAIRSQSPAIDTASIREQAVQQALQQVRLETNLNILGAEYPDIFRDQVLTQVAALQLSALRSNPLNLQRPDLDLYREACNAVRQRLTPQPAMSQPGVQPTIPAAPQAAQPAASPSREARKRAAPSIPVATDRRVAMPEDGPPAPSGSDIVAWHRKMRGQPSI